MQRIELIIDYISDNQGCSVEDVVRGLQNFISRRTIFKLLEGLKTDGQVEVQRRKPNSREHRLFVNTNNPLPILTKELYDFEKVFIPFVEKIKDRCMLAEKYGPGAEIFVMIDRFKEELGKKNSPLNLNDLRAFLEDINVSMAIEELTLNLSMFVRCMHIFLQLVHLYTN